MIKVMSATQSPLQVMGTVASTCWNSQPSAQIGIDCHEANHGRISEYPDITIVISEYSARVVREIYTHTQGNSKVQESTRYVDSGEFEYYTPLLIASKDDAVKVYDDCMKSISLAYKQLQDLNIPKEHIANILPLGMHTKVVYKINLRAILHLFEIRTCVRAYIEFRLFMKELKNVISEIDEEWLYIMDNYARTKCQISGYCNEKKSCGRYPKK